MSDERERIEPAFESTKILNEDARRKCNYIADAYLPRASSSARRDAILELAKPDMRFQRNRHVRRRGRVYQARLCKLHSNPV
jgi:hypothetical protein